MSMILKGSIDSNLSAIREGSVAVSEHDIFACIPEFHIMTQAEAQEMQRRYRTKTLNTVNTLNHYLNLIDIMVEQNRKSIPVPQKCWTPFRSAKNLTEFGLFVNPKDTKEAIFNISKIADIWQNVCHSHLVA